jgi:serine/threonine-protein kinase
MTDISTDREALTLFEAMLEAEPANPEAWIAEKAAGRPDLLTRLRALLAAETEMSMQTGGAMHSLDEGAAPTHLGGYRIGQRIGAGGMGSVYLAARDRGDFDHTVAVKIIKPGLLSERLVERFRRERQILAQLRHPNIAQLFDGGETEDGSPFIVMEFVEGKPLLDWAEDAGASRNERIDKLLQACRAVSFAHANLIVHRDITPSNVLVTEAGVAKLIDFGIARPAGSGGDGATGSGGSSLATLSLTPGYAAPERRTGVEPTTAADVYSLGRVAMKLLAADAESRELKAILDKATAQAPADRYASVDLFAADLTAWRDGFPVSVVGGGGGYALAKFVGRHRRAVWAAGIGAALLLAAFAATGVMWLRADQARAAEARRFEQVRALADYLLFDLNEQLRRTPGNTLARADLARRAQQYLDELARTPGASADVQMDTALGYVRLAEIEASPISRNLGLTAEARANLGKARGVLAAMAPSAPVAVANARVDAMESLIAYYDDKETAAARAMLDRATAALNGVAEAQRTADWHRARRDLARAELEFLSTNEKMAELVAGADALDRLVDAWPAEMESEKATEHAVAAYFRGLGMTYTDKDSDAYPVLRAAWTTFTEAERARPGDPDILYFIGWTGSEGFGAGSRLGKSEEAADMLTGARDAGRRLAAIADSDRSATQLNFAAGEVYSQYLRDIGRFADAVAEQRRIVDAKRARATSELQQADLAFSEMILGVIAKSAGDRQLVCDSWKSANDRWTPIDNAGRLIEFQKAFLPGLRRNLALCDAGRPISAMGPLR